MLNHDDHFRPAVDTDIPELRRLLNASYQEHAEKGLNYTASYQDEATTRERISRGRAFVIQRQGVLIATVLFTEQNYFTKKRTAYISQLAVHPELKGSRLGSKLMDICEELARNEGFEAVQLDTAKPATHLVDWYQRRGFKIVGETHWEGKTYDSWVFEKNLLRDSEASC